MWILTKFQLVYEKTTYIEFQCSNLLNGTFENLTNETFFLNKYSHGLMSCNKGHNNSNRVLTVGWANTLDDDTHKLIPEIRFCSRTSIFKFWPFSYGPFFKSFIINTKKGILFRIVLGDESYIKNPCISRIVCEYVRHKFWVCWMLKHLFLSKY